MYWKRGGGGWPDPPSSYGPLLVPAKGRENLFKPKSSCTKGAEEKFEPANLKWKRRGGGAGGGGVQAGGTPPPPMVSNCSNTSLADRLHMPSFPVPNPNGALHHI